MTKLLYYLVPVQHLTKPLPRRSLLTHEQTIDGINKIDQLLNKIKAKLKRNLTRYVSKQ